MTSERTFLLGPLVLIHHSNAVSLVPGLADPLSPATDRFRTVDERLDIGASVQLLLSFSASRTLISRGAASEDVTTDDVS